MAAVPMDDLPSNLVPMDDMPSHLASSSDMPQAQSADVPTMGDQPPPQQAPSESLGNKILGVGQAARAMVQNPIALAVGGVQSVLDSIIQRSNNATHSSLQKNFERNAQQYSYTPSTQTGKDILNGVGDFANDSGLNAIAPLAEVSALSRLGNVTSTNKAQVAMNLKKSQNATADATKLASREAGYVSPPSAMGAGGAVNALEGLSGKVKVQQLAITKNQPITNKLAKADLGLPDSVSLNDQVLANDRYNKSAPYREIEQLPASVVGQEPKYYSSTGNTVMTDVVKSGSQLIDELNVTRASAKRYRKAEASGLNPEAHDVANKLDETAAELESQIATIAKTSGNDKLIAELKVARAQLAKNHQYDTALNDATGNIDALHFAKLKDKGAYLDGNASKIANFAKSNRESARVPKAGDTNPTTYLDGGIAAVLGAGHAATGGVPLAAIGAPLAARLATRYGLLSKYMQNKLATPNYNAKMSPSELSAMLLNNSKDATQLAPASGAFSSQ